jgi:hypothetical protein
MPTYRVQYSSPAPPPVVPIGMVCSDCGALVPESERANHDGWHGWVTAQLSDRGLPAALTVSWGESNEEMLRRLLREVMTLSERMGE